MKNGEEKYHDGMPDSYWREKSKAKNEATAMESIESTFDSAAHELIEELSGIEKKLAKAYYRQLTDLIHDKLREKYPNYEFKNF